MKAIAYYRVSTAAQGASGLGLEAQRATVASHVGNGKILAEYSEIETGKRDSRPELQRALCHARRSNAVLVVARMDRLARNAKFLLGLVDSGVEIRFCDLPEISGASGRFLLTALAATAEMEAGLVSERTRAALQAAKRRGVRLGNPDRGKALVAHVRRHGNGAAMAGKARAAAARAEAYRDLFTAMVAEGLSLNAMARRLDSLGERTARGARWNAKGVSRALTRLDLKAT